MGAEATLAGHSSGALACRSWPERSGLGAAGGLGGAGFSGLMPPSHDGPEYMSAESPLAFHFSSKSAAALLGVSPCLPPHSRDRLSGRSGTASDTLQIQGNGISSVRPEINMHATRRIPAMAPCRVSKRGGMMPQPARGGQEGDLSDPPRNRTRVLCDGQRLSRTFADEEDAHDRTMITVTFKPTSMRY